MKLLKFSAYFILTAVLLLASLILYDLAYYDPSYLNRNAITFSPNNLNSRKIIKFHTKLDNLYYKFAYKFSDKHKKFWEPEDPSIRKKLKKNNKNRGQEG